MNAMLSPEVLLRHADDPQLTLPQPLASDAVSRWFWESKFGPIVIEVVGNDVFVNGDRVQQHVP